MSHKLSHSLCTVFLNFFLRLFKLSLLDLCHFGRFSLETSLVAQMVEQASACNARDLASIPGLERSPGEGNGNPLQYSCLENSIDRGAGGLQSIG